MSPKKVSDAEAASYWRKAQEFYLTMTTAFRDRHWNAAGLNGVHAAISATDALLGKKAHLRSSGESHYEALQLLRQHIKNEHTTAQTNRLYRILSEKSSVEYDSREFRESEATTILKDVGRYMEWVQSFFVG